MPPSFAEAIHLVSSDSAAGHVKQAGGRPSRIFFSYYPLTVGPCDPDPQRHQELRRAHAESWMRLFGLEDLRAAITCDLPVVVWGTRAYSDLVWTLWVLDGLDRIPIDGQPRFLARPWSDDPLVEVGGLSSEDGRVALAAAAPITVDVQREGADLWRRYASTSPLAFDEARRRGSTVFPELASSAELHGAWFPRLTGERLRLSELDEVVLGLVDDTSRPTYEILKNADEKLLALLVQPFHGFYPIERLRAWATHGAIARETHPDRTNPFEQDSFRATEMTRRLLAEGLERVDDAPPLYVGGCRVNDPATPWVRFEDDSGWRLGQHAPSLTVVFP